MFFLKIFNAQVSQIKIGGSWGDIKQTNIRQCDSHFDFQSKSVCVCAHTQLSGIGIVSNIWHGHTESFLQLIYQCTTQTHF